MPENSGWIALHRKLMNSDTFNRLTAIQKIIAIYLVLNANHKDNTWHDIYKDVSVEVKRGQLITSRAKIKEWFKKDKDVTEQKIRTTLDKLEKYGFLTKVSTNNYTLITICHYNDYQDIKKESNQVDNHESTSTQPSDNQVVNHKQQSLNNVNNDKQIKNKDIVGQESPDNVPYKKIVDYLNQKAGTNYRPSSAKTKTLIKARLNENYSFDDFKKVIDNKVIDANDTKDLFQSKYLRPETLFGNKFESYLNQKQVYKDTNERATSEYDNFF